MKNKSPQAPYYFPISPEYFIFYFLNVFLFWRVIHPWLSLDLHPRFLVFTLAKVIQYP